MSLQYNSGTGNSEFGLGFSLPLPKISIRTEKGIPRYDGNDIFITGPTELVPRKEAVIKNRDGWDITKYLPRVEGEFSQIRHYVKTDKSESYWTITGNDNVTSSYGKVSDSRIYNPDDPSQIFEWLIDTSVDARGNKIVYNYEAENNINVPDAVWELNRSYNNRYISNIQYGNYINNEGTENFAFEIVFNYGGYDFSGLEKGGSNPHVRSGKWKYRPDAFSSYTSGFEIRTCRLCYNIALFHHFEEELGDPCLVKNLELQYKQTGQYAGTAVSGLSTLEEVRLKGYRRNGKEATDPYEVQQMPSLCFGFSEFNPPESPAFKELTINGGAVPGYLNSRGFFPVDLNREGISGLLYHNEHAILYCEPEGDGSYESPLAPKVFPSDHDLTSGRSALVDLEGNGELELVVRDRERSGFYRKKDNGTWENYQPFEAYPNDFVNPSLEPVGLSNNGKTDLLLAEADKLLVYPSLGIKGFEQPERTAKQTDFPSLKEGYRQEYVGFANLLGDGLSHRVKVSSHSVECWPDLGYGNFGKKITLGNAPDFGDDFDAARLFLADIDGSGTSDLVYVYPDRVELFINQGGNSFSDAVTVDLPETCSAIDRISFADILGNGTTCLVFTTISPEVRHYYYDFVSGTVNNGETQAGMKPYLLNVIDNNMGAVTCLHYCSSVKFYLEDKKNGTPWITGLPFPVQVVEKTTVQDLVSGSCYTSRFAYHDGYYDYEEKEFRGFGYVESWDTEEYEDFQKHIENKNAHARETDEKNYVPPVYTRTWHHTGSPDQNKEHYYQGDPNAYDFPGPVFDEAIEKGDAETLRQAYAAMSGHVMRTEVYGDDKTASAKNPYTVTESNVEVKLFQPLGDNRYAVFMVNPRESISYQYERNPDDPRVGQQFVLETDDFGNVLQSCSVYLPRRADSMTGAAAYPEQQALQAVLEWNSYVAPLSGGLYCHEACEEQNLEISGLDLQGNRYLSYDEIKKQLAAIGLPKRDNIVLYDEPFSGGIQARQLTWNRHYFWDDKQGDALPLGTIAQRALVHHSEGAVFTRDFTIDVFGGRLIDAAGYDNESYLSNIIYTRGGYFYDPDSTYWWNRGLVQHYYPPDQPGTFFMPCTTENTYAINTQSSEYKQDISLCKKTTTGYDDYYLSPVSHVEVIDDQTQNEITAVIDCVTRQPNQVTDINGNIAQALFDPLGQVIVTSLFKDINGVKTGGMTLYAEGDTPAEYTVPEVVSFDDVLDNADKYLQGARSYFYYDLAAWTERTQPARSVNLVAFNYYHSPGKNNTPYCEKMVNYSDGLGRKLETKHYTGSRWQVSGRTVYNNKAKPCEQYMPYFSDTPDYQDQAKISSPPPTVIHYDPLLRPVRIDDAKGFFTRVEFTPWEESHYDANDTVTDSDYYKHFMANYPADPTQQEMDEKDALEKAAKCYNTPETKVVDNRGIVFLGIQSAENGRTLTDSEKTDILGRTVESIDPRLYASNKSNNTGYYNFKYRYTMGEKKPSQTDSADAGTETHLVNIFGSRLWSWSARAYCQLITYDRLERESAVLVKKIEDAGPVTSYDDFNLVEAYTYGETQEQAENKNLKGQVYRLKDLSGIITNAQYNIGGEVEQSFRQTVADYKTAANWKNNPELEGEIYTTQFAYNALGLVITETTPDGSVTQNSYNQLGLLYTVSVTCTDGTGQKVIDSIEYDAKQQRTSMTYGNSIVTSYTYEDTTLRLVQLTSTRPGLKTGSDTTTVQDISYTYDPVGNITRTRDNTFKTVFNNNQKVEPLSDYTYDALYRLTKAGGRQHPGINANTYKNNTTDKSFKQCLFSVLPSVNDSDKLENYSELYTYDDAGNLVKKQHIADSSSFTRETPVEDNSNRLKDLEYDASGNQRQLDINNSVSLSYNCCENLVNAGIIERPDEEDDCDYYLYDSSEMRTRKVSERMISGGTATDICEKIYLGNYEIKRNKTVDSRGKTTTTLERQTLRVMDDTTCIAIIHYWVKDDVKREVAAPGERSTRFQMDNNLGSVSLEMDASALLISYEEYFPYGGTALIAGKNQPEVALKDYRYSGKERDDTTGLYYYGARYYMPWLGRWLKPDPAGIVDGLNLYAFVGGNPITYEDSNGLVKAKLKGKKAKANEAQRKRINKSALSQAKWTPSVTKRTREELTVESWNTQDCQDRALGEFTKTTIPDVLLVQEAGAIPSGATGITSVGDVTVGTVTVQRERYGYSGTFPQPVNFAHVVTGSKNLMTLSVHPIDNPHLVKVSNDPNAWRFRPVLATQIQEMNFMNAHMVSGTPAFAEKQLTSLLGANAGPAPIFFAGDANMDATRFENAAKKQKISCTVCTSPVPTQKSGHALDHGVLFSMGKSPMVTKGNSKTLDLKGSDHKKRRYYFKHKTAWVVR